MNSFRDCSRNFLRNFCRNSLCETWTYNSAWLGSTTGLKQNSWQRQQTPLFEIFISIEHLNPLEALREFLQQLYGNIIENSSRSYFGDFSRSSFRIYIGVLHEFVQVYFGNSFRKFHCEIIVKFLKGFFDNFSRSSFEIPGSSTRILSGVSSKIPPEVLWKFFQFLREFHYGSFRKFYQEILRNSSRSTFWNSSRNSFRRSFRSLNSSGIPPGILFHEFFQVFLQKLLRELIQEFCSY